MKPTIARTLVPILIASAGGCGGGGGDGEPIVHSLAIESPDDAAEIGGSFTVTFAFSETPDAITVTIDSETVGEISSEPMELAIDSSLLGDGAHVLGATGRWGEALVEAEDVQVTFHNLGPIVDATGFERFSIVAGSEAEVPIAVSDAVALETVEVLIGTEVVGSVSEEPFVPAFDSTVHDDGIVTVTVRATDTAGLTATSGDLDLLVVNLGSIVEIDEAAVDGTEWDEWSISIPTDITGLDLDMKSHWTMPAGISRILTVAVVESEGEWILEYSVGEGFCPHSGTVHDWDYGGRGYFVVDLPASDLDLTTFTAGTQWFDHITYGNLSAHLGDTLAVRNVVVLIP